MWQWVGENCKGILLGQAIEANAAPEGQAGNLRWRSRELVGACPLEGLVRRATLPMR